MLIRKNFRITLCAACAALSCVSSFVPLGRPTSSCVFTSARPAAITIRDELSYSITHDSALALYSEPDHYTIIFPDHRGRVPYPRPRFHITR